MMTTDDGMPSQRLSFDGRIGAFWGLSLVNLLLTIVTIGIYRFWAKTRRRRFLWSATLFDGEPLEYRGTGRELMLGTLIAFVVIIVPLFIAVGAIGLVAASGAKVVAALLYVPLYLVLLYLLGVGVYRSQRYLLSRTAWRGIRGGMAHGGWRFGWLYLKMLLLTCVTLNFAGPFVTVRLWNARWNDASFGSAPVVADAAWRPLMRRFLLSWAAALAVYTVVAVAVFVPMFATLATFKPGAPPPPELAATFARFYLTAFAAGIAVGLIMLNYYAVLMRTLFAATRLDTLGFVFAARTGDWLRFALTNLGLIAVTLGFGLLVMPFRWWSFYLRHLTTTGHLDADRLLQTDVAAPFQGDGIADAFDVATF